MRYAARENNRGVIHEMWIVDKSEHPQIKDLKIVGGDGLQVRKEGRKEGWEGNETEERGEGGHKPIIPVGFGLLLRVDQLLLSTRFILLQD